MSNKLIKISMSDYSTYREKVEEKNIWKGVTDPVRRTITGFKGNHLNNIVDICNELRNSNEVNDIERDRIEALYRYVAKFDYYREYKRDPLTQELWDNKWIEEYLGLPTYASDDPIVYDIREYVVEALACITGCDYSILRSYVKMYLKAKNKNQKDFSKAILLDNGSTMLGHLSILELLESLPAIGNWLDYAGRATTLGGKSLQYRYTQGTQREAYMRGDIKLCIQYILNFIMTQIELKRQSEWITEEDTSHKDCLVSYSTGLLIYQNKSGLEFPSFQLKNIAGKDLPIAVRPKVRTLKERILDLIRIPTFENLIM